MSQGFHAFLVYTILKLGILATEPIQNIIFEHLKDDTTLICKEKKQTTALNIDFFFQGMWKQLESLA